MAGFPAAGADIRPPGRYITVARLVRAFGFGEKRNLMSGTTLSSEGLDPRRRRVLYRAWHRGTREMDLVVGRFTDAVLADLDEDTLAQYEDLLEVPDPELYAWIIGEYPVAPEYDSPVFRRLRAFHQG
jgi:antitoxin CptB